MDGRDCARHRAYHRQRLFFYAVDLWLRPRSDFRALVDRECQRRRPGRDRDAVTSNIGSTSNTSLFATLRIHFIPEPGLLLMLGSGIVGLAVIGRHRARR